MKYFCDESGDWTDNSKNINEKLILTCISCGINNYSLVKSEIEKFKIDNNIQLIHATELNAKKTERQKLFVLLNNIYDKDWFKVFYSVINQKQFLNIVQSQNNDYDQAYIECSSEFIKKIILGDNAPEIYWDMKFRHNYHENIIKKILQTEHDFHLEELKIMNKNYQIKPDILDYLAEKLLEKINQNEKISEENKKLINDKLATYKKEEVIKLFDLYNLDLKVNKTLEYQRTLDIKIKDIINKYNALYGLNEIRNSPIQYISKRKTDNKNLIGIELADVFSNLFWRKHNNKSDSFISEEKELMNKVEKSGGLIEYES